VHGLVLADDDRIRALNRLHESLTLATVPRFAVVYRRQMVATVKVIPFAVPRDVLAKALAIIGSEPLIRVEAFRQKSAGLVITRLPQTKPGLIAKSERAMRDRMQSLGGEIAGVLVVDHAVAAVSAAIRKLHGDGCDPVLLFGASAIVDRGDVLPAALVRAGGDIIHLGMPVDPGNLTMLGELDTVPVVGVPSCARSPRVNGFDWVLERLVAGLPVTATDVMDMGAGGLLAEIPTRPSPREGRSTLPHAPRVAALVLAAGKSERMGYNKLLADLAGAPLIRRTLEKVVAWPVDLTIVVTGRDAEAVEESLAGLPLSFVHNARFAEGLASSLAAGIAALPADIDAVVVALGDMPAVERNIVARLVAAFSPADRRTICVPVHRGQRGNPVLWGRDYFAAMKELEGDRGARTLMDDFADEVVEIDAPGDGVIIDADSPDALEALRRRFTSAPAT
jgi:molybdenum cofactor cytidylyltransferase